MVQLEYVYTNFQVQTYPDLYEHSNATYLLFPTKLAVASGPSTICDESFSSLSHGSQQYCTDSPAYIPPLAAFAMKACLTSLASRTYERMLAENPSSHLRKHISSYYNSLVLVLPAKYNALIKRHTGQN